jgi:acetoin utilization deacetylase AcuC-like enzyme
MAEQEEDMVPLVYHPGYSVADFPAKHRFPMAKYRLLFEYLKAQGYVNDNLYRPGPCRDRWLALGHCQSYIGKFRANQLDARAMRRLGLPWSEALVRRTLIAPNGTMLTARLALTHGVACHLAGGTHHAHYDFGAGFCTFNDLAITAKALLAAPYISRVLIFDCDVHQGDGTASILDNTPEAYTCSLHCEKNYPVHKARSDLDVNLPKGLTDRTYLEVVFETLERCLETLRPDIVLYDAGVDVWAGDPLGLLDISLDGIRARDRGVLTRCRQAAVPVAAVIGGGYDDDRAALAARHGILVEEAFRVFA